MPELSSFVVFYVLKKSSVCPQSIEAIAGAVSAVCEAVDISAQDNMTIPVALEVKSKIPSESSLETLRSVLQPEGPVSSFSNASTDGTLEDASRVPLPPSPIISPHRQVGATPRVFAAIRPPGHHCSDEMPSGFCFVNNVMVGVAHGESIQTP